MIYNDRRPYESKKNFAPGEFIERYQKILETVDLCFDDNIDLQSVLVSFKKLRVECNSGELNVDSFEDKGNGAFIVKVNVTDIVDNIKLEKYANKQHELEKTIESLREELAQREKFYELLASRNINISNIQKMQKDNTMNDNRETKINKTYNIQNAGIVDNQGNISGNAKIAGVIKEAAQRDLAQAAAEIQQLLDQLSQTYPTKTTSEKMTVGAKLAEEIENNPTRWQKVINVIQAMGFQALAEAVDNPIFNIAQAGIEAAISS